MGFVDLQESEVVAVKKAAATGGGLLGHKPCFGNSVRRAAGPGVGGEGRRPPGQMMVVGAPRARRRVSTVWASKWSTVIVVAVTGSNVG